MTDACTNWRGAQRHDWSRWDVPRAMTVTISYPILRTPPTTGTQWIQIRTCSRCGLEQRREVQTLEASE